MWRDLQSTMSKSIEQFYKMADHLRHTTGVACFSESCNSLLMWAHYAQNHQGLCVEYELLKFNTELKFSPVPILYSDKRIRVSSIDMADIESSTLPFLIRCMTSKSNEWAYENEWRIIRDDGACGEAWDDKKEGALLPSITPSSIILGCDASASEEFEQEVTDYCNSCKINLYKMKKDDEKYKLNKIPVLEFN